MKTYSWDRIWFSYYFKTFSTTDMIDPNSITAWHLKAFQCRMTRELKLIDKPWVVSDIIFALELPALSRNPSFEIEALDLFEPSARRHWKPRVNPRPFCLHQGMLGSCKLLQNQLVCSVNPLTLLLSIYGGSFCNLHGGLIPFPHNRMILSVVRSIVL